MGGRYLRSMSDSPSDLDAYLDEVLVGGREPVRVVIVDYDPDWPRRFEAERARIAAVLGDEAIAIEHIGSTAVSGLAAKPIVDVLVTVREIDPEGDVRFGLEAAGYELRVLEPGHLMFKSRHPEANVHIWPADDEAVERYLIFRDWLRSNADDRELYERRKRELASQGEWPDVNHYAEAKSDVVGPILQRALSAAARGKRGQTR
jgi:GrpB-like predicted nucleotidyltransferase (UPF0157 family)